MSSIKALNNFYFKSWSTQLILSVKNLFRLKQISVVWRIALGLLLSRVGVASFLMIVLVDSVVVEGSSGNIQCFKTLTSVENVISPQEVVSLWHRTLSPYFKTEQLTEHERRVLNRLGFDLNKLPKLKSAFSQKILELAQASPIVNQKALQKEYEKYAVQALPRIANSLKTKNNKDSSIKNGRDDRIELVRGYGYILLSRWDRAFNEGEYLTDLLRQRGQTASGYPKFDPSFAEKKFVRSFKKLSRGLDHEVRPVAHTLTGSDANNLFLDIARWVVSFRNGRPMEGKVFVFQDNYAAARGPLREFRFFDQAQQKNELSIPSSVTHVPPNKQDINIPLTAAEKLSLQRVRDVFLLRNDIGGILIEPVQTSKGVYFYSQAFMRALRELADQLKIPILADEVFNAGGRTGKAFSYLHYNDFVPDFVTYGKGIGSAGLAEVVSFKRQNPFLISEIEKTISESREEFGLKISIPMLGVNAYPYKLFDSTVINTAEQMLKASVIIDRIVDDRLIERAQMVGEYFNMRHRWFKLKMFRSNEEYFDEDNRFLGLLIGVSSENRYAPALTITKADIDFLYRQRTNEYLRKTIEDRVYYYTRYSPDKGAQERLERAKSFLDQLKSSSDSEFFTRAPEIHNIMGDYLPNYGAPPRLTYQSEN